MVKEKDIIALVGAGVGGKAILGALLGIPGIEIRYVCDINMDAPGMRLAKEHGIECCSEDWPKKISSDSEIDLIFEVTGVPSVLAKINEIKNPNTILIAAAGTKVVFHLLETQHSVMRELRNYKLTLEERIIERTEEIERANKELQEKIREYEELNEKLKRINEEKTKYLVQSTHQLKAPFAAIQSYTDIILDGYTGEIPPRTKEIVKKIHARCELLSTSIREMLVLANLKTSVSSSVPMENTELEELLKSVAAKYNVIAKSRGIKIECDFLPDKHIVKCNKNQIQTLFSIFIENAINYSYDDSVVKIEIKSERAGKVSVSIIDGGIGISEKSMGKIFDEYYRANEAVSHHNEGTGLGLSIAKEIADIHNFPIIINSSPGNGSAFTVTMPTL